MKKSYFRNDLECSSVICYCHALADEVRLSTGPLNDCRGCGCTWSDEPPRAGSDPFGRPDPRTHPEYWTE